MIRVSPAAIAAAVQTHLLPPTPPASDMSLAGGPLQIRRSHSLDSGLHSLTGLLDQLALGQLGSEDLAEYDYDKSYEHDLCDGENWMLVDTMSDEAAPGSSHLRDQAEARTSVGSVGSQEAAAGGFMHTGGVVAAGSNAAAAAVGMLMLGSGSKPCADGLAHQLQHKHQWQQQQQHLQTVEEVQEDQDSIEVLAVV